MGLYQPQSHFCILGFVIINSQLPKCTNSGKTAYNVGGAGRGFASVSRGGGSTPLGSVLSPILFALYIDDY